jgi:hypothetical protein
VQWTAFLTTFLPTRPLKKVVLPTRNQIHSRTLHYLFLWLLLIQNIQSIVTTPLKKPKNGQKQWLGPHETVVPCTQQAFTSGQNYCQTQKKRLRLANSNHRNPLKPRYFGLFQPWSFDRSAIVSTCLETMEWMSSVTRKGMTFPGKDHRVWRSRE